MTDAGYGSSWLSLLSTLATASVGGAGVWIGFQQRRVADRQRQNAEFDKVFGVFNAFMDAAIRASADDAEIGPIRDNLKTAHLKALLLFSNEHHSYFSDFAQRFHEYRARRASVREDPSVSRGLSPTERLAVAQGTVELGVWLTAQTGPLVQLFRNYVDPLPSRKRSPRPAFFSVVLGCFNRARR